jgi:hypothetical protein
MQPVSSIIPRLPAGKDKHQEQPQFEPETAQI